MPYGVAAVRGTFVSISVESSGKCEVSCLTGDAEVSSKNLNNQPVSTVALQGGQSSSLGKGNTAPESPTPLNNEQKLQFIQEKTWGESTAQNMDRNQEASITPAPVANPGTSLPVQTAPQAENINHQTQQALSTLEIVQEALGAGSTPTPVQPNNPVSETPSPSNPEKSLGQTVALISNQPVRFTGGIKLDLSSMVIPQGASVKISEVPSSNLINTSGLMVAGRILDIDIRNLSLSSPVELSLPLTLGVDASKAAIYYYNNGTWEYQPSWLEGSSLKTMLTHFSIYAVLIDETPPSGVQVSKGSSTTSSIELILSASDAGGVAKYQIYRDGELLITTAGSTYTDTGLQNGRSYIYKVKAIDRFENTSGFSPELIAACSPQTSYNAKLSSLSISPGNLSPDFSPDTLNYTASVAESVYSINIFAVPEDPLANVTAPDSLSLNIGENTANVVVVVQDGITTITYTLKITRAELPLNLPPVASNVTISGTASVGEELIGNYDYSDPESDPEDTSTFKWYRGTQADGSDRAAIDGATTSTYTLTEADAGKCIFFEVTPVAQSGTLR